MDPRSKRLAALEILASTGIWRSNYAPPIYRLLWRLGVEAPPPHFAGFWRNVLTGGGFFGLAYGILMWFLRWSSQGLRVGNAVLWAVSTGLAFGLAMATYYAYGRRRHGLPRWSELPGFARPSGTSGVR